MVEDRGVAHLGVEVIVVLQDVEDVGEDATTPGWWNAMGSQTPPNVDAHGRLELHAGEAFENIVKVTADYIFRAY